MYLKDVESAKLNFEMFPERWRAFGADLVDAGSPNPCNRSPIARKVLCGRWQEAYEDWLKAGEFSQGSEEIMLAFILSTEVTFHRRAPAPIPAVLPRKIWDENLYQRRLGQFHKDLKFWNLMHSHLMKKSSFPNNPYHLVRNKLGQLLLDGKIKEAEAYYRETELDQDSMAECLLAQIRSTANALGLKKEKEVAETRMWFFVDSQNRARGPILEKSLKSLFDSNRIWPDTRVWTKGMDKWVSAVKVACFRQGPVYSGPCPPPVK